MDCIGNPILDPNFGSDPDFFEHLQSQVLWAAAWIFATNNPDVNCNDYYEQTRPMSSLHLDSIIQGSFEQPSILWVVGPHSGWTQVSRQGWPLLGSVYAIQVLWACQKY